MKVKCSWTCPRLKPFGVIKYMMPLQLQNPYDYSTSPRDMLLMTPAKRAYVAQMTFVLESYEGREPETSNLSRHLHAYVHGYPEAPTSWLIKTSLMKKPISPAVILPRVKKKG